MELKTQNLKELYEKDFYLWVMENLKLLKNREYDLVDWENLLEEIEDMARRELKSLISLRGCSKKSLIGTPLQPLKGLTYSSPYPTPLPPTPASEEKGPLAKPFQG